MRWYVLYWAVADHVTAYVDSEAGHVDHEKRFLRLYVISVGKLVCHVLLLLLYG